MLLHERLGVRLSHSRLLSVVVEGWSLRLHQLAGNVSFLEFCHSMYICEEQQQRLSHPQEALRPMSGK